MDRKWNFVLAVAFFFVVGAAVAVERADASCSGDDCGCNIQSALCHADCPGEGQPGRFECVRACTREELRCSKCCCCQCYLCNPNWGCGGGFSGAAVAPADETALTFANLFPHASQCSAVGGEEPANVRCSAAPAVEEPAAAPEAPAVPAARD